MRCCRRREYGGSFEAGAGTLRLYVHAVALARQAADAAQSTMEKEFRTIDELKERLQVGCRLFASALLRRLPAADLHCGACLHASVIRLQSWAWMRCMRTVLERWL